MMLQMRPGMTPFITDENGHVPMTDDTADWLVIVTREALEDIASPPDATLARLLEFADTFGDVATFKLEHGRAGEEETIWIQSADITEWRRAQADRR
ncbi:hypothetical protein OIU34_37275 [Pararhizobium sp. BT-229]|uniref:hypothetical protein n=1 Tax=Pararhizobium sp. BT-229 TaxID=2986923 RepID=UPI0021F6A7ED|nr:hypothetical protein [Pararhizobium sp. BT-229]MCV9967485.1 hypothetical protein [Pararhizobium sp. BT-229]